MLSRLKLLASSVTVVGLVSVFSLGLASPASAGELPCASYGTPAQSDTVLEVSYDGDLQPGDTFTATATVTVDGEPADGGLVVFNYRGQKDRVEVADGSATSKEFVARPGNNQNVRADYRGSCTDGSAAIAGSGVVSILGVEAFADGNGNGNGNGNAAGIGGAGNNAGGAVVAGVQTLADTGVSPAAQLVGLTGCALVAAGSATLLIRRRRVTI